MNNPIEKTFEKLKSYFEELGFTESIYYEHNNAFDFYKTVNDVQYLIGLVYFKKKSNLYFGAIIHSSIISKNVNKILEMFTTTMGIGEHTLIQYPTYSKNIDDEYLNQLEYLILNNNDDFEIAKKVIGTHIKEYILPFFEKVPNLQTINDDIINKLTHDEYSDYIKGKSNFKVLIIMKLCNNSNFDDFKNTLNHLYNHAIEVDKLKYEVDYNSFQKLLTYLENEEYKKT